MLFDFVKTGNDDFVMPVRSTKNSAGYDMYIPGEDSFTLSPKTSVVIDYGFTLCSSSSIIFEVAARSSLFKKFGLMLGRPTYRFLPGEPVIIEFINLTTESVVINPGDVLCQGLCVDQSVEEGILSDPNFYMENMFVKDEFKKSFATIGCLDHLGETSVFYYQAPDDVIINPGTAKLIFTDLKAEFQSDKFLCLKQMDSISEMRCFMTNGIGVVDSDYFSNESNDGNIGFNIYNSNYLPITIKAGSILGVGFLRKFYTREDETVDVERTGGFGSTQN